MAFLNGIFGQQRPQQQPQQQPQNQQPQPSQQQNPQFTPQNNGNGSGGAAQGQMNGPQNSQMQGAGQNPSNPLDPFLQLMTPKPEVVQQQNAQRQQQEAPLWGNMDPAAIQQQVSKMDFMASADPAAMQKLMSGDMSAMPDVLNSALRQVFSNNLTMTQGMVEHGVRTGQDRISSSLDSRIRDFQVRGQNSQNPALQHPVGKSLFKTLTKQIATANPTLSPEEIKQQGEKFFDEFAQMILQPKQQAAQQQAESSGPNWEAFLSEDAT